MTQDGNDDGQPGPRGPEGETPTSDFQAFEQLRGRVVTAKSAYACCRGAQTRAADAMVQLGAMIRRAFETPNLVSARTPVPNLMPLFFAVLKMARPGAAPVRAYIALHPVESSGSAEEAELGRIDLPSSDAEMNRMEQALQQPAQHLKRSIDGCWKCVTGKILSQNKRRAQVTATTRGGGKQILKLRIPHA